MNCQTKYCRRKAAKGRRICHTCKSRKYRKENPLRSSYQNLKSNAKRRGKEFDLTFDQFKRFAIESEYSKKKGRFAEENIELLKKCKTAKDYLSTGITEESLQRQLTQLDDQVNSITFQKRQFITNEARSSFDRKHNTADKKKQAEMIRFILH